VLEVLGFILAATGIGLIYLPAAFIFAGAACVYAGIALDPIEAGK
jgi:hypothetical protein